MKDLWEKAETELCNFTFIFFLYLLFIYSFLFKMKVLYMSNFLVHGLYGIISIELSIIEV